MKYKGQWAILIAFAMIVSITIISIPVISCFSQTTSCEGESVYQGDGGATDYWYDDLYPPAHIINPGESTEWLINVRGGGGCSGYEHCTVTGETPPTDWTATITMGEIHSGSFHYIEPGNPSVSEGDNIAGREFYIGSSWNFDIIYNITSPGVVMGGEYANLTCTVYVVGYNPENQHDYVYVHCKAEINAPKPPIAIITYPTYGCVLSGTETITWDALAPSGNPMTFDIFLSTDNGATFPYTLVLDLPDVRSWVWDTTTFPDDIDYVLRIKVFDNTSFRECDSNGNFTIDNYAPDPPANLVIHFGLTTCGYVTAKALDDDTGSDIDRLSEDDGRSYEVMKGETLSLESFYIGLQNNPVSSATLFVEYAVNHTDYDGTESVLWKLETDVVFQSTGIIPLASELTPVIKTFDLFGNGVDTVSEIANLDIMFFNDDSMSSQSVNFDYIWVVFTASADDLALTWDPSPSADIEHYHIYRSLDDVTYSMVGETDTLQWNDAGGMGIDLTNYFYKVTGVDLGNSEGTSTYVVCKYVIPSLPDGWNMISTPLIQQLGGPTTRVLHSMDGNYEAAQTYHAGQSRPWQHWQYTKPGALNSLTNMNHKDGYFVKLQSTDDFMTLGRLPGTETIPLKKGWNLFGYPSFSSATRDVALSSISGLYNVVYRLDAASGQQVIVGSGDTMSPGNGYWIHVKQDCTLTI
jgi:hypothetical protein